MCDLKVILILMIASMQCFYLCHAEKSIENTQLNSTKQASRSSWIFIDTEEDPESRFRRSPESTLPKRTSSKRSARKPAILKPTSPKPATLKQASPKPTSVKPITRKPALLKPTSPKPTTKKSSRSKRTRSKPGSQKQARSKPTTRKRSLRKTTSLKPAQPKRTVPKFTSPKPVTPKSTSKPTTPKTTPPKRVPIIKNACNWKLPKKPNFDKPGRRISETKCEEFQWNFKNREEQFKQNDECKKYPMAIGERFVRPAVVGGRRTEPNEFPHMGALGWRGVDGDWKFLCGATLISEKFLLTAAHCSSASPRDATLANTKPEIVRLGVANVNTLLKLRNPYDGEIAQIIVHPQYASPKKYYDIAVVKMKSELTFGDKYIWPACLWTRHDTSILGKQAFVTGWGYLDAAGTKKATNLQAAQINIIESVQCDELLESSRNRHFKGLQSHQMCAGVLSGGVDTCQGDSGGPLQIKILTSKRLSYIVGVTSFGRGCARPNSPGVYTRVSSFIDWIENIVWPK